MQNAAPTVKTRVDILGAFRRDLGMRGQGLPDPKEGAWVQLGSLLAHAAAHAGAEADAARENAERLGRHLLSADAWERGNRFDPTRPADPVTLAGRIRSIAEDIESAGAMQLADAILEAFIQSHPHADVLELGRIESERARIAWKSGDLERAAARYARTAATAKKIESDELRIRAHIGRALLARLAGNYPKSLARATSALRLAERHQFLRLAASASHTIMVAAAVRGEFDSALHHGWRAFNYAKGDPILESDVLGNIGQLFLDMGHPETAVAALRVVIEQGRTSRVLLPALGGYAIAAARLNQHDQVSFAAKRVAAIAASAGTPYAIAVAFLELAEAYALLKEDEAATRYRQTALSIARERRYHELVHRAETVAAPARPSTRTLQPSQEEIAGAVRDLVLA